MKELEIGYSGNKRFITVDIIYYLDSIFSKLDNNWEVYDIDNIIELGLNDGELNKSFKNILDMLNIYFSSDIAPINNIAKIKPKTKENFILFK